MFSLPILLWATVVMSPHLVAHMEENPIYFDLGFYEEDNTGIGFRKFTDSNPLIIIMNPPDNVHTINLAIQYNSGETKMALPLINNEIQISPELLGYIINADTVNFTIQSTTEIIEGCLNEAELRALQEFFLTLTTQ